MRDACAAAVDAATRGWGRVRRRTRGRQAQSQFVATKNGRVERLDGLGERGDRRPRARDGAWGFACDRRLYRRRRSRGGAPGLRLRARCRRAAYVATARARRARERRRSAQPSSATRSRSRSTRRSRTASRPRRRWRTPDVDGRQAIGPRPARAQAPPLLRGHRGRAGAGRVRRRDRTRGRTRRRLPDAQLPERARRLELAGGLGVRRGARPRAAKHRASPSRRPRSCGPTSCPTRRDDGRDRRRADCAAGARVGRPPDRARPRLRHRGRRTPARASSRPDDLGSLRYGSEH